MYNKIRNLFNIARGRVRIIETRGCMAEDHSFQTGYILSRVIRNVYNGTENGVNIYFYRVKMQDRRILEFPVQDFHRATDGVLEYRF